MFSKKATKIDEIFTVDSKCQIYGEDFANFCDLLRKHKLYIGMVFISKVSKKYAEMTTIVDR